MTTSFTHYSTNEVINTDKSKEELLRLFNENARTDSVTWFYIAKFVEGLQQAEKTRFTMVALADMFMLSIGMGLKAPMIRCHRDNRRYKIYLSQRGNICIKSGALIPDTHDPIGDEEFMGGFWRDRFNTPKRDERYNRFHDRPLLPTEKEFMDELLENPCGRLAQWGKDMARCCFCYKALEDERSLAVGYGKTCAGRWGLPWSKKEFDQNAPTFAQVWTESNDVRGMCASVRNNPQDADAWEILGDALEDAGCCHKKPKCPKHGITTPNV